MHPHRFPALTHGGRSLGIAGALFIPIFFLPALALEVFVPPVMLENGTYPGLVMTYDPAPLAGMKIYLSADRPGLEVPATVTIPPGMNHGAFEITARGSGNATLHASGAGTTALSDTEIFSVSSFPSRLDLVLPGPATTSPSLRAAVYTLDGFGRPSPVQEKTYVRLVSSGSVDVPDVITIHPSSSHAFFEMAVNGAGTISAAAPGMTGDAEALLSSTSTVEVRLGAAPDVIMENGVLEYFVWLERDGKPYDPGGVIRGELQTTDPALLRYTINPYKHLSSTVTDFFLQDGLGRGRAYAGLLPEGVDGASATLTVIIPGYGAASQKVFVGGMLEGNGTTETEVELDERIGDNACASEWLRHPGYDPGSPRPPVNSTCYIVEPPDVEETCADAKTPNYIRFWAYPDTVAPGSEAYGILGFFSRSTESIPQVTFDENATATIAEESYTCIHPVSSAHLPYSIASPNLAAAPIAYVDEPRVTNHALFPIIPEKEGDFPITVVSMGAVASDMLTVAAAYERAYRISATPLPVIDSGEQPLYLAGILDQAGRLVNPLDEFGRVRTISASSPLGDVSGMIDGTATGIVSGPVDGRTPYVMSLDGLPGASNQIEDILVPRGVPVSLRLDAPQLVHASEEFPVVLHAVDASGMPVYRVGPAAAEVSGGTIRGDRMTLEEAGGALLTGIVEGGGTAERFISVFVNLMEMSVDAPGVVPAGVPFEVYPVTNASVPVDYTVDSPWPYKPIGNGYGITPDEPGTAGITILATAPGYAPVQRTFDVTATMHVPVSVVATTTRGVPLAIPFGENRTTPYETILDATGIFPIEFPENLESGLGGYGLVGLDYGRAAVTQDGDIAVSPADPPILVTATYERRVVIDVDGGSGSGIYPAGETVLVEAEPGIIIPYIIPERFDGWVGDVPENRASSEVLLLVASDDAFLAAEFKPDYTRVMLIIVAGTAGGFAYAWRSGRLDAITGIFER